MKELPPVSRNSDGDNSHDAERHMNDTGARLSDILMAIECVRRWPGKTARELEALAKAENGTIRKRLTDAIQSTDESIRYAIHRGPDRRCTESKRMACTWWPGAEPVAAVAGSQGGLFAKGGEYR